MTSWPFAKESLDSKAGKTNTMRTAVVAHEAIPAQKDSPDFTANQRTKTHAMNRASNTQPRPKTGNGPMLCGI